MPAPAPARGSSTCFPRRPTTASCRPSLSASARQQRRSRSCRRTRRAVTFGPMALVTTPAVVLQTYRYSETSKVVRLATRELGVQSAMAKGVLRPKSPFGAGLELLSEGMAQLYFRETRELHTLGAFDVLDLRRDLAADVGRFAGATALAEVMLKMAPPAPLPLAYDTLTGALDALAVAPPDAIDAAGVRGMWLLLGVLGFEPSPRPGCGAAPPSVAAPTPGASARPAGARPGPNAPPAPPLARLPP